MIDERLKVAAKAAFEKRLREKVEWTYEKCWDFNVPNAVKKINAIISAGKKLKATSARELSEQERSELCGLLIPLRALEMTMEAREAIIVYLNGAGVDPNIFNAPRSS